MVLCDELIISCFFRLKGVLDDLLEITISDFEEILKDLKLLSGKGRFFYQEMYSNAVGNLSKIQLWLKFKPLYYLPR